MIIIIPVFVSSDKSFFPKTTISRIKLIPTLSNLARRHQRDNRIAEITLKVLLACKILILFNYTQREVELTKLTESSAFQETQSVESNKIPVWSNKFSVRAAM